MGVILGVGAAILGTLGPGGIEGAGQRTQNCWKRLAEDPSRAMDSMSSSSDAVSAAPSVGPNDGGCAGDAHPLPRLPKSAQPS